MPGFFVLYYNIVICHSERTKAFPDKCHWQPVPICFSVQ
jgi:hypothetical protein